MEADGATKIEANLTEEIEVGTTTVVKIIGVTERSVPNMIQGTGVMKGLVSILAPRDLLELLTISSLRKVLEPWLILR